jgi:hypothetical protein
MIPAGTVPGHHAMDSTARTVSNGTEGDLKGRNGGFMNTTVRRRVGLRCQSVQVPLKKVGSRPEGLLQL